MLFRTRTERRRRAFRNRPVMAPSNYFVYNPSTSYYSYDANSRLTQEFVSKLSGGGGRRGRREGIGDCPRNTGLLQ